MQVSLPNFALFNVKSPKQLVFSSNDTQKITIFVNMWNLGQFRENLVFCQ